MATLQITAHFPLGVFLGHLPNGQPAHNGPDTARLFGALTHAAGTGITAIEIDGDLRPSEDARTALRWLETNRPNALQIPELLPVSRNPARSYRAEGVHEKNAGYRGRTALKSQSDGLAVRGLFGWRWDDAPEEIVETIDQLCADVGCLGEADSPVVLETLPLNAAPFVETHELDGNVSGPLAPRGYARVRTPADGRFEVSEREYDAMNPRKPPTVSQDKHSWGQLPGSPEPSGGATIEVAYRPTTQPIPTLPWDRGWLIPVRQSGPNAPSLGVHDRVPWAVALHRAISARLPEDAPAVLTGAYVDGARRPANRPAIHYLGRDDLRPDLASALGQHDLGAFVMLLPRHDPGPVLGVEANAAELLRDALGSVRVVYRGSHGAVRLGEPLSLDPSDVWPKPTPGRVRLWQPTPAFVPEIARKRNPRLSASDTVLLSVGNVFRDDIEFTSRDNPVEQIIDMVRTWAVRALDTHPIADSRAHLYAHRTSKGLIVQPYRTWVDLGMRAPTTALIALGQSRHLGGGLLAPIDVPPSVVDALAGTP